jgi:hypothetical protein
MAHIAVQPDTLDEATARFSPEPLGAPVFLNSLPKSGSHLLQNILRMFVPVDQQYRRQFIQWPNLQQHLDAFRSPRNFLSFGHLFHGDAAAIETAQVRKILLYRDPYSWTLARARFLLSDQFTGTSEHVKSGRLGVDDLLSLMIFGSGPKIPSLRDMYELNVVAWLGSDVYPVRFEDLAEHAADPGAPGAEEYFRALLAACGVEELPSDWQERVRVGSDRRQSGTARENLSGISTDLPDELPAKHRRLVDYAAPGLRELLGYGEA